MFGKNPQATSAFYTIRAVPPEADEELIKG